MPATVALGITVECGGRATVAIKALTLLKSAIYALKRSSLAVIGKLYFALDALEPSSSSPIRIDCRLASVLLSVCQPSGIEYRMPSV